MFVNYEALLFKKIVLYSKSFMLAMLSGLGLISSWSQGHIWEKISLLSLPAQQAQLCSSQVSNSSPLPS